MTTEQLRKIDPLRLAWACGLIEGEGRITRQITYKGSDKYNYWQLKVTSTDLDVLERLAETFGVGRIYEQKRQQEHHKQAWQYKVYRQDELLSLLIAIRPFMLSRRAARIDEALSEMHEGVKRQIHRANKTPVPNYESLDHDPMRHAPQPVYMRDANLTPLERVDMEV